MQTSGTSHAEPANTWLFADALPMPKRHLKVVQYLPPEGEPQTCAAIWSEGGYVHLASPLARIRRGVLDPQPYVRMFPDAVGSIEAFEETMTWLDAACYAATDPVQVEAACRQHPEWRLQCIGYDGSDATLLGMGALIRAAEKVNAMPEPVMRDCLLELIKQILKNEPELVGAQIESTFPDGNDVATLDLGLDTEVLVTLHAGIVSTDMIREGLLAHHRMSDQSGGWAQCLLVLPEIELDHPVFMTSRVVITNLNPDNVRAALVHMDQR